MLEVCSPVLFVLNQPALTLHMSRDREESWWGEVEVERSLGAGKVNSNQ